MDKEYLNNMYDKIAISLDISDSMREKAIASYEALGEYLDNNIEYKVDVYPQGSFNLGTIIKPINENDDYDFDLVCQIEHQFSNAKDLKQIVGNALKQSSRYSKMITKEGRRCWTLQYSEDAHFHMDVLPSINNAKLNDDSILITDKQNGDYDFNNSNPKGYAKWFESHNKIIQNQNKIICDSVEKVKTKKDKTVLQKTIQLLKRHRDIKYIDKTEKELDNKPISIIITTILTKLYEPSDDILSLINKFSNNYKQCFKIKDGYYVLENPVDTKENFADKWVEYPERKKAFMDWAESVKVDLLDRNFLGIIGKEEQAKYLKGIFGDNCIKEAYTLIGNSQNKLYIDTSKKVPTITENKTNTEIKKHNFYGK